MMMSRHSLRPWRGQLNSIAVPLLLAVLSCSTVSAWVSISTTTTSTHKRPFLPQQQQQSSSSTSMTSRTTTYKPSSTSRLFQSSSGQNQNQPPDRILRDEIAARNSNIRNEEQYAVIDGSDLELLDTTTTTEQQPTPPPETQPPAVVRQRKAAAELEMERMAQQPRAYPLFLLEKGLEIVESLLSSIAASSSSTDTPSSSSSAKRERLVVLGTGWGGVSLLKEIDTSQFDVTIVSPRNHFVFTPMLAGASVGTVEYRSICEPIREICPTANFLEATAQSIDSLQQIVSCESVICEGNSCAIDSFELPYDRLVLAVGAQTNTFGIPGVKERCNFLKSVEDARRIKSAMVNCFERANLPSSEDQKIRALTFCVIGAGPTGIEFAAELRDFVEQDGPKYYPELIKYVRIKVIEASPVILAPFDQSLQQEAIRQMQRQVEIKDDAVRELLPERFELTELLLESSVKEVAEDTIVLNDGREIPYGLAVWAAGNGPIPLTLDLIDDLGAEQAAQQGDARGRLAIDPWMRVIGSEGRILSFGDCSFITTGPLPATAQVASQQGEFLAKMLNKGYDMSPPRDKQNTFLAPTAISGTTQVMLSDRVANLAISNNKGYAKPFQFLNLGILAYTGGGSALAQVTPAPNSPAVKGSGKLGNAVWRSVYLSKQVSWRNRLLVLTDWINRSLFGRDITRV